MGFCERDSDYGDGTEHSQNQMHNGYLPPACEYPQDVERNGKAAGIRQNLDVLAEWAQCQPGKFEELDSEWDADYGDTHQQSENRIVNGEDESTQNKPENIS